MYATPVLLCANLDTAQGVVAWLRSPAMGMAEADVMRLFQHRPVLFQYSHNSLSAKLDWLLGRLQLDPAKAGTLIFRCAATFNNSQPLLESRVAALEAYGQSLACPVKVVSAGYTND